MTALRIDELAQEFLNTMEMQGIGAMRDPEYDGPCELINIETVEPLARGIQDLIANIISTLIDAGSERDAVNENEELFTTIRAELTGWTAHPDMTWSDSDD